MLDWINSLSRSTLAWAGLFMAAVILLSVNLISETVFKTVKADLTQDGLFTISDGTRDVLKKIDEPIQVKVYFSKLLGEAAPAYAKYFERIRALLNQYRDMSGGLIQLTFLDPEPFSDAEDQAVAAGLNGVGLNAQGDRGYFGLHATNSTDNAEVIAFFNPQRERFLEYDITKLILSLANPKKHVVGLMSGIKIDGGFIQPPQGFGQQQQQPQRIQPWLVMSQIREFFEVKTVDQSVDKIPDDVDILMLVKPDNLSPAAKFAIDQFALRGGKILAFIDPVSETGTQGPPGLAGVGKSFQLGELMKAWGVDYVSGKVATDIANARRVQFGANPAGRPVVTEYVGWLSLGQNSFNKNDVLSGGIERLNFASSGYLKRLDDAKTEFIPIVKSSAQAMSVDASKVRLRPDAVSLLRSYVPGGEALTLAARITGEAKTAFPKGKPKAKDETDKSKDADKDKSKKKDAQKKADDKDKAKDNSLKSGQINAIIVADTDFLNDQFWVEVRNMFGQQLVIPTAHNAVFVVNTLENLTGSKSLLALRARGVDNRPFLWVARIQRNAERKFRQKEQELVGRLKEVQTKLSSVEKKGDSGNAILSDEDKKTIENFRSEMITVRRQLRDVKHALRKDIDGLEGWLKFVNIAGVPLALGLGSLGLIYWRRRTRDSEV